jgi:uncharacterized membrane protein YccF (DUF307 family)
MRVVLNILWLVLAGVWMAIAYAVAGLILCITIIGIPFGWQSFKLAGYASGLSGERWCRAPRATGA